MQRHKQIKDLVEHLVRGGILPVDLVNHYDRLGARFQRLAQHKPRLRLRPIGGIDHQQDPVNHVHDPLHFAAEVSVAGSIDDVDVVIAVFERRVLGLDGNPLFTLQVHRIHDPLFRRLGLIGTKRPGLFQ